MNAPLPASGKQTAAAAIAAKHAKRAQEANDAKKANGADLDALIGAAENAVIERDERVSRAVREISRRVRRQAGVGAGVGAAVTAGALIARLLRRRVAGSGTAARGASLGGLAKLWSMLPGELRRMLPRRISQLVIGLLPALLHGATPLAKRLNAPQTASPVDLARYLGRWYEIARLPTHAEKRCACDVIATYAANPDGPGFIVVNECRESSGRRRVRRGLARRVDAQDSARLEVSFAPPSLRWLPAAWADYWILQVSDDYSFALVGTPDRRRLWLLSRSPDLADVVKQALLERARGEGYDTAALVWTPQTTA